MQSYYEVNVAKNGQHLFATASRSGTSLHAIRIVLSEIRARFPEPEGFSVTCTYWSASGTVEKNL